MNECSVFISYSRRDTEVVVPLVQILRAAGGDVFRDVESICPGTRWRAVIATAISNCDIFLLFWCVHSADSREVKAECDQALDLRKPVVPILLDRTPLPSDISEYHGIDMQGILGDHREEDVEVEESVPALKGPPERRRVKRRILRLPEDHQLFYGGQYLWEKLGGISSTLSFRLFINSLTVVPNNVMKKINILQQAYQIGGYKENAPDHPEVIEETMDELDLLCADEGTVLPQSWRQSYWDSGYIRAITKQHKNEIFRFLNNADDELLSWVKAIRPLHPFQRSLFLRRFFVRGTHKDVSEQVLRKLEDSGLISQGVPSGGRIARETGNWVHKKTDLAALIDHYLMMSGIVLIPPKGEQYQWDES